MKILHVVQNMSAGGLEKVVLDLCIELKRRGHEPSVFIYESKRDWIKILEENNIPFILPTVKKDGFDSSVVSELSRTLSQFDVVHSHDIGPLIYTGLAMVKLLLGKKPKWIHTTHGLITIHEAKKYVLYEMIMSRFCSHAVAVSDEIYDFYRHQIGLSELKVVTIYNGVDYTHQLKKDNQDIYLMNREKYFTQLNLNPNLKTAICVGRINSNKNQVWLAKQFSYLKNWQLLVVGPFTEDESEKSANEITNSNIHFIGPRLDIKELILVSDLFINPSLKEGLPLVILEAISTKTDVIASNIDAHKNLNKVATFFDLFELNDESLFKLLEHYKKCDAQTYEYFQNNYSTASMATQYLKLYTD